jgi:hypothetical protein
MSAIERFWARVDASGGDDACWLWIGGRTRLNGYGIISADGHSTTAHRVAWTLTQGPIPDGLYVLHNCPTGDNPLCVNPAHLWLGTIADNNRDRVNKGSADTHGILHPGHRLTEAEVLMIRARYAQGDVFLKDLGSEYGVHFGTIHSIVTRKTWKHL